MWGSHRPVGTRRVQVSGCGRSPLPEGGLVGRFCKRLVSADREASCTAVRAGEASENEELATHVQSGFVVGAGR